MKKIKPSTLFTKLFFLVLINSFSIIIYAQEKVGIGTVTPEALLEIKGTSTETTPQLSLNETGNTYSRLKFRTNNSPNFWNIEGYLAANNRNDRLNFLNGTGGTIMTLTGDGQVGIGVGVSPKVAFHIGAGQRVLWGTDTLGGGDKLMFLPDLHAFRVGTVGAGASSTYWNRDSIGLYSFASGYNTRAQGIGATAMGRDTEATNSYAFASGYFSDADGLYSTAMGYNTDALGTGSTALGYSSDAKANYSFAAGYESEAQAIHSIAIGNYALAQSHSSMAVGRYNVGGGDATTWIGSSPLFEIGNGTAFNARSNALTVLKNGNVGIGTTFPLAKLHVANGSLRIGSLEEFSDGGSFIMQVNSNFTPTTDNNWTLGNSTNRWSSVFATNGTINTSDFRDKTNIKSMEYGIKDLMKLRPVSFQWKDNNRQSASKLGLVAQDLLKVIPEVVATHEWKGDEEGNGNLVEMERYGVYYSDLIPVLIKAIQEQQEQIDELKKVNAKTQSENKVLLTEANSLRALKTTMEALAKRLNALENASGKAVSK